MKYLLSDGGGVNSPALMIWLKKSEPDLFRDMKIIFANTGGEFPEVLAQMLRFEEWLNRHGQRRIMTAKDGETLEEYCLREKINPMTRWKWCTDQFKIRPINEWADAKIGRPRVHLLGICADEDHRAKPNPEEGITNRYPLVEAGITRQACHKLLADEGFFGFVKSGCFFCPLTPSQQFVRVKQQHPDLFDRAVAMEKNSGFPLKHKFLEDIVGVKDKQMDMFDPPGLFGECGPYCFT